MAGNSLEDSWESVLYWRVSLVFISAYSLLLIHFAFQSEAFNKAVSNLEVSLNSLSESLLSHHFNFQQYFESLFRGSPSYEILFSAFQIMQNSIVEEKLKRTRPDILITTNIKDVRIHEFMKAGSIYKQSESAKDQLKRFLEKELITSNKLL